MTLTLDSSAAYEILIARTPTGEWLRRYAAGHDFVVPSLFRYETANLIRRGMAQKSFTPAAADALLRSVLEMPATEIEFEKLLQRAWAQRGSYSFYDASYIAVAEMTATVLLTADRRLADGPPVACEIVLPPRA